MTGDKWPEWKKGESTIFFTAFILVYRHRVHFLMTELGFILQRSYNLNDYSSWCIAAPPTGLIENLKRATWKKTLQISCKIIQGLERIVPKEDEIQETVGGSFLISIKNFFLSSITRVMRPFVLLQLLDPQNSLNTPGWNLAVHIRIPICKLFNIILSIWLFNKYFSLNKSDLTLFSVILKNLSIFFHCTKRYSNHISNKTYPA